MEKDKLKLIYDVMPNGWEQKAKECKALQRSGIISTAEELLRMIILYQTTGDSYGLTAALMQISDNQAGLSKQAVQKRIINSGEWLRWLCEHMCVEEGYLNAPPKWLENYRVCVVDASDYSRLGSNCSDFRLHYMMELFSMGMVEQHFTAAKEGERISRFEKLQEHDLVIADRGYCSLKGVDYVLDQKADFLFRLRSNSFNLYTAEGEKYDLTAQLRHWKKNKTLDLQLYCKINKKLIPIRICASAQTPEGIEKSNRHTKASNNKRKRGKVTSLQKIWNKYVVVATSLPQEISLEQVLGLYQTRWQIELVFKRFKSIFKGGKFTCKRDDAIKAWFYGKLLLAIICEIFVKRGRFSSQMQTYSIVASRFSLWRELSAVLCIVFARVMESLSFNEWENQPECLPVACAETKRRRRSQFESLGLLSA